MMGSIEQWSKGLKIIPQLLENLVVLLMAVILVGVTVHFLTTSINQLSSIQNGILQNSAFVLPAPVVLSDQATVNEQLTLAEMQYLITLESRVQENRYRQAGLSLMTRIWISYLGFVTGMILALVGASFILGKLKIDEAHVGLEVPQITANLKSTSPGLLMAGFGVILIITTILTNHQIKVTDPSTYIQPYNTLSNDELNSLLTPVPNIPP